MDVNRDQEIQESNPQKNKEPTNLTTKSKEDIQVDKYTIMLLKEKWEKVETLLKRRNNLNLINIVMSSFVILFGIALLYMFWKKNISDTVHIITSSVLASSGALALLNILGQKWKQNKDNVTSLVGVAKKIPLPSDKVFMPALLQIPDELINDKLVGKCKDYLRYLDRIKDLITIEKRSSVQMLNYTIELPDHTNHMMIFYTLKFIFLKPTIEVVAAILSYYYALSKRLYLIDDKDFTLDDYSRVSFFGNDEAMKKYKILPNEETNTSMSSYDTQLEEDTKQIYEEKDISTQNLAEKLEF
ncbi:266_t:CDS:2, partial [Racocetra fulgida]